MSHTVACGRSKKKKCVCQCGGKLHGNLVVKENRAEVLIDSSHDTQVLKNLECASRMDVDEGDSNA